MLGWVLLWTLIQPAMFVYIQQRIWLPTATRQTPPQKKMKKKKKIAEQKKPTSTDNNVGLFDYHLEYREMAALYEWRSEWMTTDCLARWLAGWLCSLSQPLMLVISFVIFICMHVYWLNVFVCCWHLVNLIVRMKFNCFCFVLHLAAAAITVTPPQIAPFLFLLSSF